MHSNDNNTFNLCLGMKWNICARSPKPNQKINEKNKEEKNQESRGGLKTHNKIK